MRQPRIPLALAAALLMGGGLPRVPIVGNPRREPTPPPPPPRPPDAPTRQTERAKIFRAVWDGFKVAPDAHGTKKDPIVPRRERRKLARAYAAKEWRDALLKRRSS